MMVISGSVTHSVPERTGVTDTIVGEVGEIFFPIQGDAAEGVREGAAVTVTGATIGGTAVVTSDITVDLDNGRVILPGIVVSAATHVETIAIDPLTQTTHQFNSNILRNAWLAGAAVTVVVTNEAGTALTGVTFDIVTRTYTFPASPLGENYTFTFTIPEYTTVGIPRGSVAQRTAVITYTIPAHVYEVESIYPADKCAWEQQNSVDGRGYRVSVAHFFPGASVNFAGITASIYEINNAQLGVIGKSGRFVAISNLE